MGKDELELLFHRYADLPKGSWERLEAMREAVRLADQRRARSWQLANRYNLAYELAMYNDLGQVLPLVSEYAALYEETPFAQYRQCYLYLLYLALTQWECLPQLPLDQRDRMAEQFRSALLKYRLSLRDYHERLCFQYVREGRLGEAQAHFEAAAKLPNATIHDCSACLQHSLVYYAYLTDDWPEAIRQARPILDGTLTCDLHPRNTLFCMLEMALDRGHWGQSRRFARELEVCLGQGETDFVCPLIRWYAFSSPASALGLLERRLDKVWAQWDQAQRFYLFRAAWIYCVQADKRGGFLTLRLPEDFPLYRSDGRYAPGELAMGFYGMALDIGLKFDTRNGSPWHQTLLQRAREGMERMEGRDPF
ncbi:MAG: hypothetical protein HFF50_07375 [Lawsonibacter sp.]|nr:hypothetical protein [Lawsonibacter sp.]